MKLHPKAAVFCPGCPSNLSLLSAPQLIVQFENKKDDTLTITIVGKPKKQQSTATSLF